jgi:hypothetical protein
MNLILKNYTKRYSQQLKKIELYFKLSYSMFAKDLRNNPSSKYITLIFNIFYLKEYPDICTQANAWVWVWFLVNTQNQTQTQIPKNHHTHTQNHTKIPQNTLTHTQKNFEYFYIF